MGKEYAVMGAKLECDKGTAPSNLVVLPDRRLQVNGKLRAHILDCVPMTNVMPFGMCKSMTNPAVASATAAASGVLTPQPCTPTCSAWIGGKTLVLVSNKPSLLKGDKTVCPLGLGMIEVKESGQ